MTRAAFVFKTRGRSAKKLCKDQDLWSQQQHGDKEEIPYETVIKNASSDGPSRRKRSQRCAQGGHSSVTEQVTPLPAWDDETSLPKSSTASPLASLGRDSSLCPTGDFVMCQAASASEQLTLARGSPEESPGLPTALTVTAVVFMGTEEKQQKRAGLWPLSWLVFAPFRSWLDPIP